LVAPLERDPLLYEGGVIQAAVRERLLGIPLLRLEATVALVPGTITVSGAEPGKGLTEAVRSLNEGTQVLEHVRRDGRKLRA
jgi:hypothetical protein